MARMGNGISALALSMAAACAPNLDLDERPEPGRPRDCAGELAPHDVQGPGAVSPFEGQRLRVAGVVTLVDERGKAAGFFMQSLEADGDPRSSEALFVAYPGPAPVAGTFLAVVGVVVERAGETWLDAVERLEACGRSAPTPAAVDRRQLDTLEPLEHMLIEAHADWTVIDVSEASLQSGALLLSPHGRSFSAGHELGAVPPVAGEGAGGLGPASWRLEPVLAAATGVDSLPRRGARAPALTGVLRVEAAGPRLLVQSSPAWAAPVPPAPARGAGGLRVAALNVHDYFVHRLGRGARSEQELQRQRAKLVAALRALDADVLALTELENAGSESLEHLLEGLGTPATDQPGFAFLEESPPGGSELRAGIAYRPGRVQPRGPAWFEGRAGFRRPPLFQSFETAGGSLTLGVVHFKSKRCGDEPTIVVAEGCGADTRRAEAELLLDSLRGLRASRPLEPLLVMGDLNSDPLEAPVLALQQGGLVDLLGALPSTERYSFVHEARASLLDHAWGSPELAARAHGAAIWHINADEASFRDYSLANPPEAYVADARRSSDHDPVVIDLAL